MRSPGKVTEGLATTAAFFVKNHGLKESCRAKEDP